MPEWHPNALNRVGATTAISDVYKAMQARLDGYRQGAGAIMIGVFAAVLAVDSAFIRALLDKSLLEGLAQRQDHFFLFITGGSAALVIGICIAGHAVIRGIGRYFGEMTSVVYKIDQANKMWEPNYWFRAQKFYPNMFRATANVTRNEQIDPVLIGWFDPTIRGYQRFVGALCALHVVFFGSLIVGLQ